MTSRMESSSSSSRSSSRPSTASGGVAPYALHVAASQGRCAEARRLIRDGATVNEQEEVEGWTPLHIAAGMGYDEVVELLISEGAVVHYKDSVGWTPLHSACRFGHRRIAELLVGAGADAHAVASKSGKSPLEYAEANNHLELAAWLRATCGDLPTELENLSIGAKAGGKPPLMPRTNSSRNQSQYVPTACDPTSPNNKNNKLQPGFNDNNTHAFRGSTPDFNKRYAPRVGSGRTGSRGSIRVLAQDM